jgi:tetratricopeptide (TPR) repeat protein
MSKLQLKCVIRSVTRSMTAVSAGLMLSGCSLDVFGWRSSTAGQDSATLVAQSANLEMARSAFNNRNYGIAISHLERELAVRPESVSALNGLGAVYDQIGRFDVAQRYYFRALELASDPSPTLANLGYSAQLQGKPGEALRILELALYFDPGNEVARANIQAAARQLDSQPPVTEPAINSALRVEISNGSGVTGMAARVRSILREHSGLRASGGDVVRLTNADRFNYTATTVFYRSGLGAAVTELISSLPSQNLRFEESDQMAPGIDVRVLLGRDYIPFDSPG